MIPYGRQTIEEDDIQAVVEVLRSDWLTTGPKVEEFEEAFAEYVGAKYAVSFSSGTAALHGAISIVEPTRNIQHTSEIITTPMTFVATANSILYADYRPVFADVNRDTLLLDPKEVEAAITDDTVAIIAVDYAGQPCDYDTLRGIADWNNLFLIADACHSLGATYKSEKVGTLADMTVFSFHPVKLITTGEGGMVTTNSKDYAEILRAFRNHGRENGIMGFLGFNYRLTDIQCALGLSQLKKANKFLELRREIARGYDYYFNMTDEVTPLSVRKDVEHAYHLYVVKLKDKKNACDRLNAVGVTTTTHYPLIYNQHRPYYTYFYGDCPNAEMTNYNILSLPIYPTLSHRDQRTVIDALMEV